jgi:hypothetical protein
MHASCARRFEVESPSGYLVQAIEILRLCMILRPPGMWRRVVSLRERVERWWYAVFASEHTSTVHLVRLRC